MLLESWVRDIDIDIEDLFNVEYDKHQFKHNF